MENKLRRKFIILAVSSVVVVLAIITSFILISNYMQVNDHANELLQVLVENNGSFPMKNKDKEGFEFRGKLSPEAPFSTRFFTAIVDKNGNCVMIDTGKVSATDTNDAMEYVDDVLESKKESGFIDNYKYSVAEKSYGRLIVFVDCSRDLQMFHSFLINCLVIGAIGILAVFLLVLLLSKKAVAPIVQSYEKQKKFITNSSHELKTPLAVISTSTDVLEMDNGSNEWTDNIKNQVTRLTGLINQLVSLTRMDEEDNKLVKTDFSISDAVIESVEPFVVLASSKNKTISSDIEKNLTYFGDESSIRQLVSILMDNAVKYALEGTDIKIVLQRKGKRFILQTINQSDNLSVGNYNVLFERFYRVDSSRNSKTGGYGIGLSIAKAVCEKHKGKITAESKDGKSLIISATLN